MPDATMQSEITITGGFPTWDFEVVGNLVPVIDGDEEFGQQAAMLTFIDKNSIPQLPGQGVPWTDFLTGVEDFPAVDTAIRYNLTQSDLAYKPNYEIVNTRLTCTVARQ